MTSSEATLFYPTSVRHEAKVTTVYFTNSDLSQQVGGGWRLSIRISVNGRLISVKRAGIKGKVLHDRSQKGGPRLPSLAARRWRDIACAVVAFVTLGHDIKRFPPQQVDL